MQISGPDSAWYSARNLLLWSPDDDSKNLEQIFFFHPILGLYFYLDVLYEAAKIWKRRFGLEGFISQESKVALPMHDANQALSICSIFQRQNQAG